MLYFPHETIRESQKEMIEKILENLTVKKSLIVHAPTGLGKTAASLSAALSYAYENKQKKLSIIFVTPKHTQHKIAVETLRALKTKHNLDFDVVDLIGKRWMCAQPGVTDMNPADFSDYCKNMVEHGKCDYYSNLKFKGKTSPEAEATVKQLSGKLLHVEELKDQVAKRRLCPYEIAALLAQQSKVLIADYYHILSPGVREYLFKKINRELDQCIIIFDEAHNLADRSRELLSVQVSTTIIEGAAREASALGHKEISEDILKLKESLEKIIRAKTSFTEYETKITKDEFIKEITSFIGYEEFIGNLNFIAEQVRELKKRSFAGSIATFLLSWTGPDEAFARILKKGFNKKGRPTITLYYNCLDPSLLLKPLSEEAYALLAMSGTLNPLSVYKDLFGFVTDVAEYRSPFPKTNKLNLVVPDTSTKFTLRDATMFQRIAAHCASVTNVVPGNTAIFFPSYELRDNVYKYFESKCEKTCFLEMSKMNKQEKNDMIESFKKYKQVGAVLLGASAGNFGEGLDIKDNILKCVIVVGLPLSKPDMQTQELITYYDKKFGKGWDYGYTLPALIKCFQNAGRAIRSEQDKGVIVYLDERFTWDNYFKAFPKDEQLYVTKEPLLKIKEFFAK